MWRWASAAFLAGGVALASPPSTPVAEEELKVPATDTPEDAARYLVQEGCPEKWTTEKVQQRFWPNYAVFRLTCPWGGFGRVPSRTVAVSSSRKALEITEDVLDRSDRRGFENFNAISRHEHVAIDRYNAQEYFEFFLDAHLEHRGIILPSERLAAVIRRIRFGSKESELVVRSFAYENPPVVRMNESGPSRYQATTIQWLWWCRGMERITLVADQSGQLTFSIANFGVQAPERDEKEH
jgi:hypothetical protein